MVSSANYIEPSCQYQLPLIELSLIKGLSSGNWLDSFTLWAKQHDGSRGTGYTNVCPSLLLQMCTFHCSHSHLGRIAWPLDAEQPINAAYLALSVDIAFEMLEVRTGYGLKPLYRGARPTGTLEAVAAEARDVLQRARGPEGDRKRKNAERIRGLWQAEWEEGGNAMKVLRQFLSDNCGGVK
jgi:hypothetical protein